MSTEKYCLPDGSTSFFKSSSDKRLFSSIRSESKSICTFGELFTTFFFSAKDEPIFHEGFLALIYVK
jgi:hypothetical protein